MQWHLEEWDPATTARLVINMCSNIIISFQPFLYHFEVCFCYIFLGVAMEAAVWFAPLCILHNVPLTPHILNGKSVLWQQQDKWIQTGFPSGEDALFLSCSIFLLCSEVTGQQSTVHSTSELWWWLGMEIVFFWKKQFSHSIYWPKCCNSGGLLAF